MKFVANAVFACRPFSQLPDHAEVVRLVTASVFKLRSRNPQVLHLPILSHSSDRLGNGSGMPAAPTSERSHVRRSLFTETRMPPRLSPSQREDGAPHLQRPLGCVCRRSARDRLDAPRTLHLRHVELHHGRVVYRAILAIYNSGLPLGPNPLLGGHDLPENPSPPLGS
ncbi:MAG: hypothetical protein JWO80_2196 [Bryobacterales bacterium]|nr:hypothetical protein [Bryobacterales bacterium]